MSRALMFLWVFLSKFMVSVFGLIIRFVFRFQGNENCEKNDSGLDGFKEKQRIEWTENENRESENGLAATSSKYEFLHRKDISGFIEEPKTGSFTLLEFHLGSGDTVESARVHPAGYELERDDRVAGKIESLAERFVSGQITEEQEMEANAVFKEKTEDSVEEAGDSAEKEAGESVDCFVIEKKLEKYQPGKEQDDAVEEERPEPSVQSTEKLVEEKEEKNDVVEVKTGASFLASSIEVNLDYQETFSPQKRNESFEIDECVESNPRLTNSGVVLEGLRIESVVCSEKLGESISNSDEEEDDDLEYEQLQMQLKIARTGGLPTISEESEFSKVVEELQLPKIDVKLDHKHHIAEIQKVYKCYSERMRKLDILSSQISHAISLLKLNDPVRTAKSSAIPVSLLTKNIWPFKQPKLETERAVELIRDLHRDLEIVYVGQICLSWELLCWQHGKLQELLQNVPQGIYQFIHVTTEFQLFQVLVHRFLEDEPFQGRSRVENYVKNRCLLPTFLQVPMIKDDRSKKRYKETRAEEGDASATLTKIMEQSIQVFWEFLRADKDETKLNIKAPQQTQVAPQDPLDLGFLIEVRTDHQKKEKRLKEIMRITNCMVKKLQEHRRTPMHHAVFIAQVELKLVSRVLNMSKLTTEHLVWCREKLGKMSFRSRKLEIEPSMLLFPC